MLNFKKVRFTPQTAQAALDATKRVDFNQRHIAQARVDIYAGAMKQENWSADTGETVKFGLYKGAQVIVDGQHRLAAVVKAGVPVELWVCTGIDPLVFAHIDQGASRTVADVLSTCGWGTNSANAASAGRMLWKEDRTGDPFEKPEGEEAETEGDIAKYINETYRPALAENLTHHSKAYGILQREGLGGKAWLAYIGMRIEATESRAAWTAILETLIDPNSTPVHPAWRMATKVIAKYRESVTTKVLDKKTGKMKDKILMGENRNLTDFTVRAYRAAWQLHSTPGRRVVNEASIKNIIKQLEENGWQQF